MFTLFVIEFFKNALTYDILLKYVYNYKTKTLFIHKNFNHNLNNVSKETKIIEFHVFSKFNQKVNNLPESLTYLTFGTIFNQKVDNLPQNLTHLTLSFIFNQKVDNLPKNLTHLTFRSEFNQKVDNLPKNLTHLTLSYYFNQKVVNLPKKLKYLKLYKNMQQEIILPKNLKKLSLTSNNNLINNIPDHIEKIYIYFSDYNEDENQKVENLPLSIKKIVINHEFYKKYIKIPFNCIVNIKKINNHNIKSYNKLIILNYIINIINIWMIHYLDNGCKKILNNKN